MRVLILLSALLLGCPVRGDYQTAHKLAVQRGKLNTCTPATVGAWEAELLAFWAPIYPAAAGYLSGRLLECRDTELIPHPTTGVPVHGWQAGLIAAIGWKDLAYARSLFRHEVSHIILSCVGFLDQDAHHAAMQRFGLGD